MTKDLLDGKVVSGKFALAEGTVTSINIPDDVSGIKLFSEDTGYRYNINTNPDTSQDNTMTKGAFGISGIMETRVIQLGENRSLKILPESTGTILVEFWVAI